MTSFPIELSEQSIKRVLKICDTIRRKNPKNHQSLEMADGIGNFVKKNGCLSEKQAQWICRNADYCGIARPVALSTVVVGKVMKQSEGLSMAQFQPLFDDVAELLRRVKRVEKRLK